MERNFKDWIESLPESERERGLVTLHIRYKRLFLKKQLEFGTEKERGDISEKTAGALHNLINELREIESVYREIFPAGKEIKSLIPAEMIPELRHVFTDTTGAVTPAGNDSDLEIKRLNNELSNSHLAIKRLKSKVKFGAIDREQLISVMDTTRKKNGKANLSAIGRTFGRDKHTIKRYIISHKLLSYSKIED